MLLHHEQHLAATVGRRRGRPGSGDGRFGFDRRGRAGRRPYILGDYTAGRMTAVAGDSLGNFVVGLAIPPLLIAKPDVKLPPLHDPSRLKYVHPQSY